MRKAVVILLAVLLFVLAGCAQKQNGELRTGEIVEEKTDRVTQIGSSEEIPHFDVPSEIEKPVETVDQMIISITAGDHIFTASLYDNAASRAFWDKLPLTLPMMNLYEREMCYRFGKGGLPDDDAADTGHVIGDISYWPPAGSLVILYKQNGEVFEQQPIGHTNADISFFDGMPDTDITFEKAK